MVQRVAQALLRHSGAKSALKRTLVRSPWNKLRDREITKARAPVPQGIASVVSLVANLAHLCGPSFSIVYRP